MSSADTKPRELRAATPLNGEDIVAPERLAPWHPESIIVEITSAARYLMKRDAWHDLARRACEPNPYMDPAIVAAAAGPDGGADEIPVLLAWRGKQLVGAWAFSRSVPRSRFPLSVLTTPLREMLPNSTPVLDAGQIEAVLSAMMDAIVRARPLPKLLSIDMINDGGPVMHALQHVLAGRKCPMVILRRNQRPMLIGSAKPADHFGKMMSGNTRRSFNTK